MVKGNLGVAYYLKAEDSIRQAICDWHSSTSAISQWAADQRSLLLWIIHWAWSLWYGNQMQRYASAEQWPLPTKQATRMRGEWWWWWVIMQLRGDRPTKQQMELRKWLITDLLYVDEWLINERKSKIIIDIFIQSICLTIVSCFYQAYKYSDRIMANSYYLRLLIDDTVNFLCVWPFILLKNICNYKSCFII